MTHVMTHIATTTGRIARPLEGRVALVTGSTSGIGLGIARELVRSGCHVMLNGFGDPGTIQAERDALQRQYGVEVIHDDADMSDPHAIEAMLRHAAAALGPVDILVNNAGIQHVAPIETFPVGRWRAVQTINLEAAFHTTRLVLAGMKERGYGRIINIASAHGLIASRFKSAYVAAKHGLVGLTKVTALEAAEHGVTCNAVCPGYVLTPLVERQIDEQAAAHGIDRDAVIRDIMLAQQPTRRFVTIEEIAGTVTFLCGASAASITGIALSVDGGWTAH